MRSRLLLLCTVGWLTALGCSDAEAPQVADYHGPEGEGIATTSQALTSTDPVSAAVSASCSTSVVKGLAVQLVQEIECLRPRTMKRIDGLTGISLGTSTAAVPYLQIPAADALVRAQKARGVTMKINSGLRTLPQQFLLYQWYLTGRCGIGLAASPGTSNHESGIAVDIDDNAGWRSAMEANTFSWLGSKDPVHFNYVGKGSVALSGLSVQAFQRLWNRNHPTDKIDEDGDYGPQTEARLKKSPIGGFPIGPASACGDAGVDAGPVVVPDADGGETAIETEEPPVVEPDDAMPGDDAAAVADAAGDAMTPSSTAAGSVDDEAGCSVSAAGGHTAGLAGATLAFAIGLALRSRRRAAASRSRRG